MAIANIPAAAEPNIRNLALYEPDSEPLPIHDFKLESKELIWQSRVEQVGHFVRYAVQFSDGSRYQKQVCEPESRTFDIAAAYTTPWLTQIDGLNTEMQSRLALNGIASEVISAPEFPLKHINNIDQYVNLSHDAAAQIVSFEDGASDGHFNDKSMIVTGFSRGSIVGWGVLAYAKEKGIAVPAFDFIDPCLAAAARVNPLDYKNYVYLGKEIVAASRLLARYSSSDLWGLRHSLGVSPQTFLANIATGYALFHGQAHVLLEHVPSDLERPGVVRFYDGSRYNQFDEHLRLLANHPNIRLLRRHGVHASGIDTNVQQRAADRIMGYAERYEEGEPAFGTD